MMTKKISLLAFSQCLLMFLAGCDYAGADSPTLGTISPALAVEAANTPPAFPSSGNITGIVNEASAATTIALNGNAAQISGNGAEFASGTLTISAAGTYIVSGKLAGQILIDAAREDIVRLVLNGLSIHNEYGPAIFAPRSSRVELVLADGSINIVSDGAHHPNDNSNAAIYVQHDLHIWGTGTLYVASAFRHGLRSQAILTVQSGTFNIVTVNGNALQGRDGVIIHDGEFNLIGGGDGDGIRSSRENDPDRGFITIYGGIFVINAGDDGLQAESALTIHGGDFTITAYDDGMTTKGTVLITGGRINILDSYEGIEGLTVTITGGDIFIAARDDGLNARLHEDIAEAFLAKLDCPHCIYDYIYIRITGGNIEIWATGDGIDSNGDLFIEGGSIRISANSSSREGAVDFARAFQLTGGEIIIAGGVQLPTYATQPIVSISLGQNYAARSLVEVGNSCGSMVLEHISQMDFSAVAFSSAHLEIAQAYYLYIAGARVDAIVIGGIITNNRGVSDAHNTGENIRSVGGVIGDRGSTSGIVTGERGNNSTRADGNRAAGSAGR